MSRMRAILVYLVLLVAIFANASCSQGGDQMSSDKPSEQSTNKSHRRATWTIVRARQPSEVLREEMMQGIGGKTPVIGILSQVFRDYKKLVSERHLHMSASYVKWMEAAGAQVLPILLNQPDEYYERVFQLTNGLLFPGGDNLLDPNKNTPMMVAAKKLYALAVEANDRGDYYPIWGTCLGLELLSVLSSGKNALSLCSATDMALPMDFVARGELFGKRDFPGLATGIDFSRLMMDLMQNKNLTYNFHHFCLTDQDLAKANLQDFYQPLAYSYDANNIKFIAAFEAKKYPFFAVQFHPEKTAFEFVVKKGQKNVPHNDAAISVARYLADFFVSRAKLNKHKANDLNSLEQLRRALIYATNPLYGSLVGDIYEQRYVFPYTEVEGISDEEFIDHILEDDEQVSEAVPSLQRQEEIQELVKLASVNLHDKNLFDYEPNGHPGSF